MQAGKATLASIQSARSVSLPESGATARAKSTTAARATAPLCWRLSQDRTVKGGVPAARRWRRAATMRPKTLLGASGWVRS